MLIPNHLGKKTLLTLSEGKVVADTENAINDARAALKREKGAPSVKSGNVSFLAWWIRLFEKKESESKPADPQTARYQSPQEMLQQQYEEKRYQGLHPGTAPLTVDPLNDLSNQQEVQFGKLTSSHVIVPERSVGNLSNPSKIQFGKPSWEK